MVRRSYGSVALVARGKDAVALRQRDIGRVQDMLRRGCSGARKCRIRRAGLGASQVCTSRLHEEAQDIGWTAAALPMVLLSEWTKHLSWQQSSDRAACVRVFDDDRLRGKTCVGGLAESDL